MELQELQQQLDKLIDADYIRPSTLPYGASVLFQRKKDDSLWMCVDYQALNRLMVRDRYLIPLIADLLDRLGEAHVFSKLDLKFDY